MAHWVLESRFIVGEPCGQPRPRARVVHTGRGPIASVYHPRGTALQWRRAVERALLRDPSRPWAPLDQPVQVSIVLAFLPPKNPQKVLRERLREYADSSVPHTSKPDVDNAAKIILDALVTTGWLRDDSLVYSLRIAKYYVQQPGNRPGCSVEVAYGKPHEAPDTEREMPVHDSADG